jgi:hypothetical protein
MRNSENNKIAFIAIMLCLSFLIPMIYMVIIGTQRDSMRRNKTICENLFNMSNKEHQ